MYLLRPHQRHPRCNPPTLTRPQHKRLFDPQHIQHLQVHLRRIPVRPVLAARARLAMAQQLDRQQVHGASQRRVFVLLRVEF